jgi:hypothetical protein
MEEEGWTVVGRRGLPKGGPRRANVATAVGGSAGAGVAPALTKGGHPVNWCAKAETGPVSRFDLTLLAVQSPPVVLQHAPTRLHRRRQLRQRQVPLPVNDCFSALRPRFA